MENIWDLSRSRQDNRATHKAFPFQLYTISTLCGGSNGRCYSVNMVALSDSSSPVSSADRPEPTLRVGGDSGSTVDQEVVYARRVEMCPGKIRRKREPVTGRGRGRGTSITRTEEKASVAGPGKGERAVLGQKGRFRARRKGLDSLIGSVWSRCAGDALRFAWKRCLVPPQGSG